MQQEIPFANHPLFQDRTLFELVEQLLDRHYTVAYASDEEDDLS